MIETHCSHPNSCGRQETIDVSLTAWAPLPRLASCADVKFRVAAHAILRGALSFVTVRATRDRADALEQCICQSRDTGYHRLELRFVLQCIEVVVDDINDDVAELWNVVGR